MEKQLCLLGIAPNLPKYCTPSQRKILRGYSAANYHIQKITQGDRQSVKVELKAGAGHQKGENWYYQCHFLTLILSRLGTAQYSESLFTFYKNDQVITQELKVNDSPRPLPMAKNSNCSTDRRLSGLFPE